MESTIRSFLQKQKGFTLIELLIVIAIIAILTVAFLPTLRGGQAAARDAARKATMNNIVTAIERIVNGDFVSATPNIPAAIPVSAGACLDFTGDAATQGGKIKFALGRVPSSNITNTPLCNASSGYFYKSFGGDPATNYLLVTQVENLANANVSGGTPPPIAMTEVALNGHFNDWTNTLTRTAGAAANPLYAITK